MKINKNKLKYKLFVFFFLHAPQIYLISDFFNITKTLTIYKFFNNFDYL